MNHVWCECYPLISFSMTPFLWWKKLAGNLVIWFHQNFFPTTLLGAFQKNRERAFLLRRSIWTFSSFLGGPLPFYLLIGLLVTLLKNNKTTPTFMDNLVERETFQTNSKINNRETWWTFAIQRSMWLWGQLLLGTSFVFAVLDRVKFLKFHCCFVVQSIHKYFEQIWTVWKMLLFLDFVFTNSSSSCLFNSQIWPFVHIW